jgi:hypothetical protein
MKIQEVRRARRNVAPASTAAVDDELWSAFMKASLQISRFKYFVPDN